MELHSTIMGISKVSMIVIFSFLLVSLSACMRRNITGDYSAKIYHYPNGRNHENIESMGSRQMVDTNGVIHIVYETQTLHVVPQRMETTTRFFFHIDDYLNVYASYSEGGITPPTNYHGKGKLKNDSLTVQFFYREIKDIGLEGEVYDSVRYSPKLSLRFSVKKGPKNFELVYLPYEQEVDTLETIWNSYYIFETQE